MLPDQETRVLLAEEPRYDTVRIEVLLLPPAERFPGSQFNEGVRDYVRFPEAEIRQNLERGSYLTVDHRAGQAFLHTNAATSFVSMRLFRQLNEQGHLEQVNADDPTAPIAIYRQASGADAGSYGGDR